MWSACNAARHRIRVMEFYQDFLYDWMEALQQLEEHSDGFASTRLFWYWIGFGTCIILSVISIAIMWKSYRVVDPRYPSMGPRSLSLQEFFFTLHPIHRKKHEKVTDETIKAKEDEKRSKKSETTQVSKTCEVVLPQDKSSEQTSAIIAVTTKITQTPARSAPAPTTLQTPAVLSKENLKKSAEKAEAPKASRERMLSQEKLDEHKLPTSLPLARTMSSESSPGSKEGVVAARSNEKLLPSRHASAEKLKKPATKPLEPLTGVVGKKSAVRTAPPRLSYERIAKGSAEKTPLLPRKSS
ncbi:hypothetical protein Y032_0156g3098 [Ancylostoma ceylanicum]|uniref:Uncharacterized protein n=1 Tax=Ancylostoma ceylanicum TaxID=53326 RepID=A0A016SY89_9BILA|nr:hypothetical protein Y032_0156g3098 [Ancylostoma ceylanicum]